MQSDSYLKALETLGEDNERTIKMKEELDAVDNRVEESSKKLDDIMDKFEQSDCGK